MEIINGEKEEVANMMQSKIAEDDFIVSADKIAEDEGDIFDPVSALVDRIDAKIKELEEREKRLGVEEEKILGCIKDTLDKRGLKYAYVQDSPKMLEVGFGADNKILRMMIILQNEKIIFRLVFPFRIQCNSSALVTLYIAQYNEDKALSRMHLDFDDGEVTMEYSYFPGKAENFDAEHFWIYMMSLVYPSQVAYTRLNRLAIGKVSKDVKELYKSLLEKSLAIINGEEEDENDIIYGCEDLMKDKDVKKELLNKLLKGGNLLEDLDDEKDEESLFSTSIETWKKTIFNIIAFLIKYFIAFILKRHLFS